MSSFLFSMNEAIEKLNCIMVDSIILKMDFTVEAAGQDIEKATDFSSEELAGQPLSAICEDGKLPLLIKSRLREGYFGNVTGNLLNKKGESIQVVISGFYLGLISDLNGYIVLKIKPVENLSLLEKVAGEGKSEIDSFIYRAAHDLRGPLATIKGLVNLLKGRKDNGEVDELTRLVELHANKLDDRLFKLLYMADITDGMEAGTSTIDFEVLERDIRTLLSENCHLENATLCFNTPSVHWTGVDEVGVYQLLKNALLYLVSLPVASIGREGVKLELAFSMGLKGVEIEISASGFRASDQLQALVQNSASLYDNLLANPYLFDYYLAKKRASQLGAFLKVDFYGEGQQTIKLLLPKRPQYQTTKN